MKRLTLVLAISMLFVNGCSVFMAAQKQTKKDLKVIRVGEHRDIIVQTLGAPNASIRTEDGGYKDIYKIVENAGTEGGKTFAVAGHATMDVLTLGLWEIVGSPMELATVQEATTFIIYYDSDHTLESYEAIK
jgi:hypothetical protein